MLSMKEGIRPSRFTRKFAYEMHPLVDLSNIIRIKLDKNIGIIADTHLGSTTDSLRKLNLMYDEFEERKIKQVFHAGDLVDGERIYRGHSRHIKIHGFEAQANYAIRFYPERDGIKTYIISGNHDMSFYKDAGADIVKKICSYRKDLEFAGMYYARFRDDRIKLDLLHPSGSPTYAKSYPIQRWIRNNEMPSTYPDLLAVGHYHTHGYFTDHEIECILAGNFQRQNSYTLRKGYTGVIGGWAIGLNRKRHKLGSLKLEWIRI